MRQKKYKKYFLLGLLFFGILSLPSFFVEKTRFFAAFLFSPLWKKAAFIESHTPEKEENSRLEAENHLLRVEISKLKALLEQKNASFETLEEKETFALLNEALPARVIFRDPASWSSSLWIDVGETTNRLLKKCVIKKNSPVVVGRAAVGCIDYVGKNQSRVRLITDVGLKPAVRALRGRPQNLFLVEHIDILLKNVQGCKKEPLVKELEKLKEELSKESDTLYLAKGILQGSGNPFWRNFTTLRGIGFNYDFEDEKGPAREFITGKPLNSSQEAAAPILKVHDLLVTTGMDGVFPAGLRVGHVSKVYPLREGAYTYEIEAFPAFGHFDTLHTVFILPPNPFDADDISGALTCER